MRVRCVGRSGGSEGEMRHAGVCGEVWHTLRRSQYVCAKTASREGV